MNPRFFIVVILTLTSRNKTAGLRLQVILCVFEHTVSLLVSVSHQSLPRDSSKSPTNLFQHHTMGPKGAGRKTTPLPTPTWNFAKVASEVEESGNTTNSPLKYHTGGINDVKHDLLALKKGEVYSRDEFYNRVKAWYKAEIDRVLLLEDHKRVLYQLLNHILRVAQ